MSQTLLTPELSLAPPPDADSLYEVVDGRRVEKPPTGTFQIFVTAILDQVLGTYASSNQLGRVFPEMLFRINPAGSPIRRPDIAFVSYERWPRERKVNSDNGWDVIPDLAIEVISPSNTADEVISKVREYFQAGVRRVWVVYPSERQVYVYSSPTKNSILGEGDDLDGEEILPGFRLALAELFEDGQD